MDTPAGNLVLKNAEGIPQVLGGWIDFGATGEMEIWQCIWYILLTPIRSVCLDRDFGMDYIMIDKPMPIAQLTLTQEILMKINLFEPRARFDNIRYTGDGIDGRLSPEVTVRLLVTT
jgi:phage baseplate assembly protein W